MNANWKGLAVRKVSIKSIRKKKKGRLRCTDPVAFVGSAFDRDPCILSQKTVVFREMSIVLLVKRKFMLKTRSFVSGGNRYHIVAVSVVTYI